MTVAGDHPMGSGRCGSCGGWSDVLIGDATKKECVTCWCKRKDAEEGITIRYFLGDDDMPEDVEVTKEEWVAAERRAGFHNTLGHPDEPGTGSFSTTRHNGLRGRIERVKADG